MNLKPALRRFGLSLRLYSVQLAIVAGALSAWFVENPDALLQLLTLIPDGWRPLVSFVLVSGIPLAARLARQPDLPEGTP